MATMTEKEFKRFKSFIYDHAGIDLAPAKQVMVSSRLNRRLNYYQLATYTEYFELVMNPENKQEFQVMVDLLTTNETYFFREPKHFDFLKNTILKQYKGKDFRLWSAASSSGEEVYSIAMILAENLAGKQWRILGTDLSTKVLKAAHQAVYMMDRIDLLDQALMKKYCLKGVRSQENTFKIGDKLRERVRFKQLNLMKPLPPKIGMFDVIFLRNVLIYFDNETKKQVVERIISALKPGGYFFISHSETLTRITDKLEMVQPSIYMKR